jgi:hypothetical protein
VKEYTISPYSPDFKKLKKKMITRGAKTKTTTMTIIGLKYVVISSKSLLIAPFATASGCTSRLEVFICKPPFFIS